ncbi:MAG: DUF481 domain-containing protein [Planctomycetota bacterium]|jgi:hypothetical protein
MNRKAFIFFAFVLGCGLAVVADEIRLKNGDTLNVTVVEEWETELVIKHENLGEITISKSQIASRKIITEPVVEETPASPVQTPEPVQAPKTETYYFIQSEPEFNWLNEISTSLRDDGWKMALTFSFNADSGEKDEQRYRVGYNVTRETEQRRYHSDLSYYFKTRSGETTDNKLSSGMRYDWLRPESPWLYFVTGRYDFDEFESWQHRLGIHTGPGYMLIDNQRTQWEIAAGAGFRKEWKSDNDSILFEGIGTTGLDLQLSQRQSLNFRFAFYPVLDDYDDYRTRTTADWNYLISREMNLSFSFGLHHEYQSIVDPGEDRNDTRVYSGIRFDF